jgi:hypothetical protein
MKYRILLAEKMESKSTKTSIIAKAAYQAGYIKHDNTTNLLNDAANNRIVTIR